MATVLAGPSAPNQRSSDRIVRSGTSGAAVSLTHVDGRHVAVKVAVNPRVSAAEQRLRRAAIEPLFPGRLPRVLAATSGEIDVLVTACPTERTLQDAIDADGPTMPHRAAWSEITRALVAVWQRTAKPGYDPADATRCHAARCRRAVDGLTFAVAGHGAPNQWRHLVVDDMDYGSWPMVLDRLRTLGRPEVRVACHGDPQPANVLLDTDGRWHLIDWEWAGHHHDWRMMVSHLLGWWLLKDHDLAEGGTLRSSGSTLAVEAPRPPQFWTSLFLTDAASAYAAMSRTERDLRDLGKHTALLLLREVPRLCRRGQPWLAWSLLADALRLIGPPQDAAEPHPSLLALAGGLGR